MIFEILSGIGYMAAGGNFTVFVLSKDWPSFFFGWLCIFCSIIIQTL